MKLKDRIEELEKRVALLEQRPMYILYPSYPPYNPNPNPNPNPTIPYNPWSPFSCSIQTKEGGE